MGRCKTPRKEGKKRNRFHEWQFFSSIAAFQTQHFPPWKLEIEMIRFSEACPDVASVIVVCDNQTPICVLWLAKRTPLFQLGHRLSSGTFLCTNAHVGGSALIHPDDGYQILGSESFELKRMLALCASHEWAFRVSVVMLVLVGDHETAP